MKRLLIVCCLLIAACGCSPAISCSSLFGSGPCTRVLFIGNSYTYVNDLPTMFAELAGAGGHRVETGMDAPGGWTLANHVSSSDTLEQIKSSDCNYVVLQEQSEIPSIQQFRTQQMYPASGCLFGISEISMPHLFSLRPGLTVMGCRKMDCRITKACSTRSITGIWESHKNLTLLSHL